MTRKLFLLLTTCAAACLAQFETAVVLGTVTDSTQAVVTGVRMTLENVATGVRVERSTDANGNYEFPNVRIGRYRVTAEKEGFQRAVAEEFTVTINARQRVDLMLQVGATAESVTVSAAARLLETDSSDRGQVIGSEQIVNLPLNGRAYADLALLAPGVRKSAISSSRDASFNVNGLRSSLNNFVVDGVDNNSYGTSNQGFSNQVVQLSPDAVAEFKVQTNNYSAEFGRAGGAVVNASVRSGTNQFHGAAWNYLRNTSLNAVGFFKPLENRKPTLTQNQFGGAVGGPIQRDKMFFFADYEGYRRISRQLTFSTLPTADERNGILGVSITNPLTGRSYPDGRIPLSDMTPFARKVLSELPAVNRSGISQNYEALPRRSDQTDKGDFRFDYYPASKLTTFARYSHRLMNNFEPPAIPGPSGGNSNANVRVLNYQLAFGGTYTMTPTSLLDVRLGYSITEGGKFPIFIGQPPMSVAYGITGIPEDPRFAGGLTAQEVGGYTAFGQQSSNPQFQNPQVINPKVNYSLVAGRHSLKMGYEHQRINTDIDDFNPKYGRDQYNSRFSRPAGSSSTDNRYNIADFMFGLRNNYALNNDPIITLHQRLHFLYLQDDFKVSPNLTLNAGLRYEFGTPQWESQNRLSNFDPVANRLIQASGGSIYDRTLIQPDKNNFAPRLGLAYNVTRKTVIRSGAGVSYVHFNRLGGENLLSYNLPFIISTSINQTPNQGPCAANQAPNTCFRPTQDGYPAGLVSSPALVSTRTARTNFIPADARTSYVASWHFTIQQELVGGFVLDLGYVGNRSNKLVILSDWNEARFNGPGENLSVDARRPIAGFTQIQIAAPWGYANYNALQAKIERRFSRGLYVLNSFTWAKAMDNTSGHLEAQNGDDSRLSLRNIGLSKGPGGYNQKLNNTLTFVYELPFGRGKTYGSNWNGPVDFVLGGWRLTNILTSTSGSPINLAYNPEARYQVGTVGAYRPNVTGNPLTADGQREWFNWLDGTKVEVIRNVATEVANPYGNAGRNLVDGPGYFNIDLGLHKNFALPREGMGVEFRGEFFNLTNRTNFNNPTSNRSSNDFGRIGSTQNPRQVQLALKLVF
jgi:hypothetical protein